MNLQLNEIEVTPADDVGFCSICRRRDPSEQTGRLAEWMVTLRNGRKTYVFFSCNGCCQIYREVATEWDLQAGHSVSDRLRGALSGSDDYLRLMFRDHVDTDPILGAVLDCNAIALNESEAA